MPETELSPFEGLPVVASGFEIPGASGGLQPAMKIDPQEFAQGDEVYIAFRVIVAKVRHEPIVKDDPTGPQCRVHIAPLLDATIIDGAMVGDAITSQRLKIEKAREEEEGISKLPGIDEPSDPTATAGDAA